MIGRGSGAASKSGPAGGRRPRRTATSASGTTRTRRRRPRRGSQDLWEAGVCGRATASDGRLSTGTRVGSGTSRSSTRPARVAVVGRARRTSCRRMRGASSPRAGAPAGWTCAKRVAIGTASCATRIQAGRSPAATRGSPTPAPRVVGSTSSAPVTGIAGSGSTAGVGATAAAGASIAGEELDSAGGAGAPGCPVATGVAGGSSSAGISAVGSSS
jgi:hypothetical protein